MALNFSDTTTDNVNHGSDASLDTYSGGTIRGTILAWVYPTTLASDHTILSQMTAAYAGLIFRLPSATGDINMYWQRATTNLAIRSSDAPLSTNAWQCVAAVWDSTGADADQMLFYGTPSAALSEVSSYTTQQVGSGAVTDVTAEDVYVGSSRTQDWSAWAGRIALVALWNTELTVAQLRVQQFSLTPIVLVENLCLFCNYGFNGTGTQRDWSGNPNHGTVTGTTVAPHAPLVPFRVRTPGLSLAPAAGMSKQMMHYARLRRTA